MKEAMRLLQNGEEKTEATYTPNGKWLFNYI